MKAYQGGIHLPPDGSRQSDSQTDRSRSSQTGTDSGMERRTVGVYQSKAFYGVSLFCTITQRQKWKVLLQVDNNKNDEVFCVGTENTLQLLLLLLLLLTYHSESLCLRSCFTSTFFGPGRTLEKPRQLSINHPIPSFLLLLEQTIPFSSYKNTTIKSVTIILYYNCHSFRWTINQPIASPSQSLKYNPLPRQPRMSS